MRGFSSSLILFLILLSFISPALAETDEFESSVTNSEEYNVAYGASTGYFFISNLTFREIDYYNSLSSIYVDTNDITWLDPDVPNSAFTYVTFSISGDPIGNGLIGYGRFPSFTRVYIYMDTWNIGSYSGAMAVQMVYDNSNLYNITNRRYTSSPVGDEGIGLFYLDGPTGAAMGGDYLIYYREYFLNRYTYWDDGLYYLYINKSFDSGAYNSSWIVTSPTIELLNETNIGSATNNSVISFDVPLTLEAYDSYGNYHTDTIFEPVLTGAYTVGGIIFNSKTGTPILNATVYIDDNYYDSSDTSGFYSFPIDEGTYTLTCTKTGYNPLIYDLIVNNNQNLNLPLSPLYDNTTIDPYTCVIYGAVLEKTTGSSIQSVRVTADNGTQISTFSNSLGYYELTGLVVDDYELSGEKEGYYPAIYTVDTTAPNTSTYQLIEMVNPSLIITPTPTPATDTGERTKERVYSLFESFGMSEKSTNYILALLIILACAGIVAGFIPKAALGGATLGSLIGILISAGIGLVPMWLIVLFIFIGSLIYVYKFFGEG